MATKNLYFQSNFQRNNPVRDFLLSFTMPLASIARMLIEVFIRKDFGERYFRFYSAVMLTVFLAFWPWVKGKAFSFLRAGEVSNIDYITWYIFLALFLGFSVKHYIDLRRNPSVFDFARFSLSSGKINPIFFKFELPWRKTDQRLVEIWIEPALFFVAGFLLFAVGQSLGILLMISAVVYGLSYAYAYNFGDNFVMDKIDEIIINEELKKAFVDDAPVDETRGFAHRGRRPIKASDRDRILAPIEGRTEKMMAE